MFRRSSALIALLILGGWLGCSGTASEQGGAAGEGWVECVVPRPEACTHDWRPVCGLRDTGVRCVTEPCDSWETRTYANACVACSDVAVYGWRPEACPEEGSVRGD